MGSPPYTADREFAVYGAGKTEAEKALWKFVKEQEPHFICNTILPNCNFGNILVDGQLASSGAFVKLVYDGNIIDNVRYFTPRR